MTRRQLFKNSAGLGAALDFSGLAQAQQAAPANDRIGVGVIGCGNMGTGDLIDFQKMPDVEIVAVCDVNQQNAARAQARTDGKAKLYSDYRRVLESNDIHAVVVATPDHWHPKICVDACQAGKDVYCEKPVSNRLREGRIMVDTARAADRVVQVGLQQRSGTHFQRAVQIVQNGEIGKVHYIECFNHTATAGGGPAIPPDSGVPQGLDWDFWLGPAPKVAYSAARQRSWRGFFDYGSGGLGDWGVHVMDIALWAMNAGAPQSISCMGARYLTQDPNDFSRSDTPDTVVVLYEFPGFVLHYSNIRHNSFGPNGNPGAKPFGAYGTMFHGTLGTLFVDRAGLEVVPQLIGKSDPNGKQYPRLTDDESAVNMFYTGLRGAERGSTSVQHYPHVRNFLDCVKSRKKPIADIEAAHLSTSICHLANVSYKTGEKLVWDGKNEKITNNSKANELLTRTYRAPWRLQGLA